MLPIPDNETESPLAIAIDMNEFGDNETRECKWCDIWLVTPNSMIHLLENIFGDDLFWDCKAMFACDWEASLIFYANISLTTSLIKGRGLWCKIKPRKLSKSLSKAGKQV